MPSSSSTASASPTAIPEEQRRVSLGRRLVLDTLSPMQRGYLRLELPGGEAVEFGDRDTARPLPCGINAHAAIKVKREAFFQKCVLSGDLGFAESFIDGDWESPDLSAVIAWFILNIDEAPTLSGSKRAARAGALNVLRLINRLGHLLRPNSRTTARRNISEHYDLSNEFFGLFLDPSMMYSAARWPTPDLSLEEAQRAKNDALCQKLQLQPTDRVLEIGSGWGGWSMHAARTYGCHVTTLTISQQQYDLATARIAAAGLSDRIEVKMCDYRDVTGSFDKIVSIEMMEAIGHRYLPQFCSALHRVLKPQGLLALQFITCPDDRYDAFRKGVDFIQKHIFPGSLLLSLNRVNDQLARAGGFVLNSVEDFAHDYARTLQLWREAFNARLDEVRALGFDERFIRKWSYYLHYCEAAFALRNIGVVHTLHTRANNLTL
ncbi:SAM-dependent methyltransferase [Actomonas aquatica]|uniref:Cyclopropane-fatty-acyl-phospholipid synthase family protein n=1 Tax=Actomonas aquatica TaxID=2866162 RepID=A0ABZ1CDX2_9BACT|nr:cyclopropane-fatty-acyl-phospholipid synthase family protein [Opitutus sp. WL0086]WRQ89811.1 cyclopropane-fatty-acyl-phospholipid synthase family protein [Opitutus sp. WL0086]